MVLLIVSSLTLLPFYKTGTVLKMFSKKVYLTSDSRGSPICPSRSWFSPLGALHFLKPHISICLVQSCNKDSLKIDALLKHKRFLSRDVIFIAIPLYNRFFNYPIPCPFLIDSLRCALKTKAPLRVQMFLTF